MPLIELLQLSTNVPKGDSSTFVVSEANCGKFFWTQQGCEQVWTDPINFTNIKLINVDETTFQ
jgi:hypothetical protein